ncbi:cell division protein ZapA [Anaerobium acetethylicum]|uniref:Cell division protein ZapA n=1 Tax=Anaerobium acetethylicum TaxID=1619234 RepID=A0A1D3TNT4_9FIRM|nr:cell division protein ZapA [Anaerobium acetethylicum]SCP94999.1 cell division protein ZapA [Anaerobium acetethylicum]
MASKNNTQVLIGGRVLTLSGYESEEYLHKVASYINNKQAELNHMKGYSRMTFDIQSMLLEINIADDYFKAKTQVAALESDIEKKEKEIYDIKHELISERLKYEDLEKKHRELYEKNHELQKEIIKLETEMDDFTRPQ